MAKPSVAEWGEAGSVSVRERLLAEAEAEDADVEAPAAATPLAAAASKPEKGATMRGFLRILKEAKPVRPQLAVGCVCAAPSAPLARSLLTRSPAAS